GSMMNLGLTKKSMVFTGMVCLHIFRAMSQLYGQTDVPPWVYDPPYSEHEIYGIGVAQLVNRSTSMNIAELRARSSIAMQLFNSKVVVRPGDDDFNDLVSTCAGLEASFEIMKDTRVLERWTGQDGTSWALVAMRKSDAAKYDRIIKNIFQIYASGFSQ
ncbi:MAG: LPP20 family lipoprotein, partial [Treponema sp.]|nr:LPP20 family lipoprotein [Treponema sp.]